VSCLRVSSRGCASLPADLLSSNITDDIICAKRIVRNPHGMNAWYGIRGRFLWQGSRLFLKAHGCALPDCHTKAAEPHQRGGTTTSRLCRWVGVERHTCTASASAKHLTGETREEGAEKKCFGEKFQVKNKWSVNSPSTSRLGLEDFSLSYAFKALRRAPSSAFCCLLAGSTQHGSNSSQSI